MDRRVKYSSSNHLRCKNSSSKISLGFLLFIYCVTIISCVAINDKQIRNPITQSKKVQSLLSAMRPSTQSYIEQPSDSSANRDISHEDLFQARSISRVNGKAECGTTTSRPPGPAQSVISSTVHQNSQL